jgi:hypothetical protein
MIPPDFKYNMVKKKTLMTKRNMASKVKRKVKILDSDSLDQWGVAHAKMLYDPCDSLLEESVYPGDRGYVNRFQAVGTYGTGAGATSFMTFIKPGNICSTNFDSVTSATTNTLAYSKAAFPGATFLAGTATKARAVAFCISLRPIASANNATGTIYFGVVNANTFRNSIVTSPDTAASFLTNSVSSAQALLNPLEIKWSPGGFDDRYADAAALGDDDSDRNILVVVGTGFPAASGVQYRMTSITEWAPAGTFGIIQDATAVGRSRNDIHAVTKALKMKDSNWWWSLGTKTLGLAKAVVGGYAAGGAIGALGSAVKFF